MNKRQKTYIDIYLSDGNTIEKIYRSFEKRKALKRMTIKALFKK